MADNCLQKLVSPEIKKALFGEREIPDKVMNQWLGDIQEIKAAYDAGELNDAELNRNMNKYIESKRTANEIEQRTKLGDVLRNKRNREFLNQEGFKGKPVEAFHAMLTKTDTLANSGRSSINAMDRSRLVKYTEHLRDAWINKGIMKQVLSGQLDEEAAVVIDALTRGLDIPKNISADAIEFGKSLKEVQDLQFLDMQDADLPVKFLKRRVSLQTHDSVRVSDAGFDAWSQKVMDLGIDKQYLGPRALTKNGLKGILQGIYGDIVAGKYGNAGAIVDGELIDTLAEGRISSQVSKNRILQFTSPQAQVEYNRAFGSYETMAQTVFSDLKRKSKQIALFERLGDRPRENFEAMIDRQIKDLEKINVNQMQKLRGQKDRLMNEFDQIAGHTSVPGNETIAKIGRTIGALDSLGKLYFTGVRSVTNLANASAEIRNATGQTFLGSFGDIVKDWGSSLPDAFKRTWLKDYADVITTMTGDIGDQMNGGTVSGKLASMGDFMMKVNGQDIMNTSVKQAVAQIQQRSWAREAANSFDKIPEYMQAGLLQAGLKATDWPLFKHMVETAANGSTYVTPEAIGRKLVETEEFKADLKNAMEASGWKKSQESYRRNIEDRLRAYMIQSADIATTTAGARETSRLNFGTRPGTPEGEFMRLMGRFKSFTLQSFSITKTFLNSKANSDLLAKGVLASEGKSYGLLAQWIALGTALGYVGDTLVRASRGDAPNDPSKPGVWMDSMAKSGVGGMYVDFFNGEWDKYDYGASFLGPTLGQIPTLAKGTSKAMKGEFAGATMQASKIIRSYIPFQQAVGMKQLLDFAQYDLMNETLNPGSSEKYRLKKALEKSQ